MYPTNKIYIIKVKNRVYLAFLENRDGSKIKFFGSNEIIPTNEVYNYISKHYNKNPIWIRQVHGTDGRAKYCKNAQSYYWVMSKYGNSYYNKTPPPEYFDIVHDLPSLFDIKEPYRPSDNPTDYELSDNDVSYRELKSRMKDAFKTYEQEMIAYNNARDNFPSFLKNQCTSYTDSDVCDLMEWLKSHDPEKEPESEKYYSSLDF